jgi:two-component system sensor histidine kinase RegB
MNSTLSRSAAGTDSVALVTRPPTVDPALALRWLSQARRGVILAQTLLLAVARFGTDVRPPLVPLVVLLGGLAVFDIVERRRAPTERRVVIHAAVDLLALTGILLVTGGAQNPLQAFYLVEVALLAIVLPGRAAWMATGAAVLLQAVATVFALHIPGFDEEPHHHHGHLAGHVLAFDLAAVAVTAFVGRLSAALRERQEALRASEAERARSEKLAALGTLAAGTAHALGTPLGAIELLAEEMALEPTDETLGALRGEVRRCRAILDRMLAGDGGADGTTDRVGERVAGWVEAWRAGQPGAVQLEVDGASVLATVLGGEEGWRDAMWTLLDNARAAGEPIRVMTRRDGDRVLVTIEDSGPQVPPERLARAGQPFFSAWPSRKGTGLGLYVARTFARAASGDVLLEPCPEGGARAILTMVVVEGT